MHLPAQSLAASPQTSLEVRSESIEILEAFSELPDVRKASGKCPHIALCLALFTLALAAGNRGFLSIGDWLRCYQPDLIALFNPPKRRLPSYSTSGRVLLKLDYSQCAAALARFFGVDVDGKVLRGSYQLEMDNPDSPPHPAIVLVSAYLVERGLMLEPYPVDCKTNEIKALPELIEQLALKGNQGHPHKTVPTHFVPETSYTEVSKGHGRIEKRVISLCTTLDDIKPWPGFKTLIRVESERHFKSGGQLRQKTETRYYIASYLDSAAAFAQRIRGYWGVENKVHPVRDVTQGEDASRIRMHQLPQIFAVARKFALNLYRSNQFSNMAQAERLCKFGLDTLKSIFRMK